MHNRTVSGVAVLAVLLILTGVAGAATQADYQAVVDASYDPDLPGAAFLVSRGDEVLFRGARGMADLELEVPLRPELVFRLGSITKQFTGAAVMLLAEEGKLSVGDTLDKFLPDYPGGDKITVEHLLHHTSGIVSYTGIPGYMAENVHKDVSVEELIDVFDDLEPEFEPGTQWNYNNSGYILLGAIVEKASGMDYAEFVRTRLFEPLGMSDSHYGDNAAIIPRRVEGYGGGGDEPANARYLSMTQPYAAGSLLSTVDDMRTWTRSLHAGKVVSKESLKKMTAPGVLPDGEETGYGYGLMMREVRGTPAIGHGGDIFGFATYSMYLPEHDLHVTVLSNYPGNRAGPTMVADQLAALALGKPFPARNAVTLAPEQLDRYVGVYRIDDETTRIVTLDDGVLYTKRTGGQTQAVTPYSENGFFYQSSLSYFELELDGDGKPLAMQMHQGGAEEIERAVFETREIPHDAVRTEIELEPAILERYVGDYAMPRPGFEIAITLEDGGLYAQATGQPKFPIFAESENTFFLKVVDAQLVFEVEGDGPASGVVLHQGGRQMAGKRK